jgi:hypothetical protein
VGDPNSPKPSGKYDGYLFEQHGSNDSEKYPSGFWQPAVAEWFFKYAAEYKDNLATGGWVGWGACYGNIQSDYMDRMKVATGVEKIWISNGPKTYYDPIKGPYVGEFSKGGAWLQW